MFYFLNTGWGGGVEGRMPTHGFTQVQGKWVCNSRLSECLTFCCHPSKYQHFLSASFLYSGVLWSPSAICKCTLKVSSPINSLSQYMKCLYSFDWLNKMLNGNCVKEHLSESVYFKLTLNPNSTKPEFFDGPIRLSVLTKEWPMDKQHQVRAWSHSQKV